MRGRAFRPKPLPRADLSQYGALMSKRDVAKELGYSVRWVEIELARGTFPIPRLTRMKKPKFLKVDVQAFLDARTHEPIARPA